MTNDFQGTFYGTVESCFGTPDILFYLWNNDAILTKFVANGNNSVQNKERSPKEDEQHENDPQNLGRLMLTMNVNSGLIQIVNFYYCFYYSCF